jgi:hypothetical protein
VADKSHTVLLYGGSGPLPPGDPDAQVDAMLGSFTRSGTQVGPASTVDTGAVGGKAKCAAIPGGHADNCGWIKGPVALVMSFQGFEPGAAQQLVPTILAATVSA